MTTKKSQLRPTDFAILRKGRELEEQGLLKWTRKDLPLNISYLYFRHRISHLVRCGYVTVAERSSSAYYNLTPSGDLVAGHSQEHDSPAPSHLLSEDELISLIMSLGFKHPELHDIRATFPLRGAHSILKTSTQWVEAPNGTLSAFHKLSRTRSLRIQCYATDRIEVFVACSSEPFPASVGGLIDLASVFGLAREHVRYPVLTPPDVSQWVVVQLHFNADTRGGELSGQTFNATFTTLAGALGRIYSKGDNVRVEEARKPMKTLAELTRDILGETS